MNLFYQIVFFLQAVILGYSAKLFHDICFTTSYKGKSFVRFCGYSILFIQSFITVLFDLLPYINFFTASIAIFITSLSIKTPLKNKIQASLFFLTFIGGAEFLVLYIAFNFLKLPLSLAIEPISHYNMLSALLMCSARIISLATIYYYQKYAQKQHLKQDLTFNWLYTLAPILVHFMFIICSHITPLLNLNEQIFIVVLISFAYIFLVINFFSFIKHSHLEEYRTRALLFDKEMELYAREHQIIGEYLKELSVLKHNINHELLPILSKLPKENREIAEEFTSVFDKVLLDDYQYFSNYSWLDLILNYHLHNGNEFHYSIQIDPNLSITMDSKVIGIILGNLLENAREAQEQVFQKEIKLRISNQNSNLFIKVENPFTNEIILANGLPVSTKKDHSKHGFGLSSVKNLVENHGGIFKYSYENKYFIVELLLLN